VRTEKFNGILLSTLIVVSLMAPALLVVSILTAGQVSAEPGPYDNVVRAKDNAYNKDETADPPWQTYEKGSRPPIIVADTIGSGRVVAGGIANSMRNGYWNGGVDSSVNPDNHLDVLLDAAFQWMRPGPLANRDNVLWYEGYGVYSTTTACSVLVGALTAKGYRIVANSTQPITAALLNPYDILVIPQLQLGGAKTGGDPSLLPDADVTAIKNFVEGGKGLLIAEGCDVSALLGMQFYKVQDKILRALNFPMYFQSDQVIDDVNKYGTRADQNWLITVDVDNNTWIGDNYDNATGKTRIGLPSVCSLAPLPDYGVSVTISPGYMEGLPGGTLKYYEVKVTNMGKMTDNYTLTATDNSGWDLTLEGFDVDSKLENVPGFFEFRTVKLKVKVAENAPGTVDNITVTASGTGAVSDNYYCLAIIGRQIRPTMDDSQVVEGTPTTTAGPQTFMYVGSSTTGRYLDERAFLKFDLQGIASRDNITSKGARLFLYEFTVGGTPGKTIELRRVENDNWVEENITWNDQPAYGTSIGTKTVTEAAAWYSWDVTDYVKAEFEKTPEDNIASFCIKSETEDRAYPDNFSYGFDTKEFSAWAHPRIAIGRNVWMAIDPEYREGLPGGTVKYTVDVWNMGSLSDTYNLSVGDNAGWSPTISPNTLALAAGQKGTATVSVTIPVNARICVDNDNITVAATSQNDPTVKDNVWTIAHPAKRVKPAMLDTSTKGGLALGLPPTIWGIDAEIYTGHYAKGPERGWLRFDLGAIPSLDNIARARLKLHSTTIVGQGAVVRVYSVANDTWIEDENWTSTPPIDNLLDTRAVIKADENYSWDVTAFVRDQWENDPQKLASFALVDLGENIENVENHAARFTSREDWDVRDEWPYLEILCAAQLPTREVRTSISPIFQGGETGKVLTYTVTVKNTGTSPDTYNLTVVDGWGATVLPTSVGPIAAGGSNTATLSVTVPVGTVCTLDKITVTATSQAVGSVYDNAVAFAHLSYTYFKLENMTMVSIDLNLRLREDAKKLVAAFYFYYDGTPENSVIWENIMPWHMISIPYIMHPKGRPVEKVNLVLVDGTGAVIATVDTHKVIKPHLIQRASVLKGQWDLVPPGDPKTAIIREISMIKAQWELAPTS